MKLAWITDPHLDHLDSVEKVTKFGRWVSKSTDAEAVVITGDIAECHTFADLLARFHEGWQRKVYFVLGNHDYYYGSFLLGQEKSQELCQKINDFQWLDESGVVKLTDSTALVGNGGWYDGRCGRGDDSNVDMCDFQLVADLRFLGRYHKSSALHAITREMRKRTEPDLRKACEQYPNVFFATHVPPFKEACWHNGSISNSDWLPWFTNLEFGAMLSIVASDFPNVSITALCGHSHGEGTYQHDHNLRVLTGKAEYGSPAICKVFEVP